MQAAYRGAIATKANVGIGQVTLANFVWGAVRRLAPRTAPAAQQPERQLSAAAVPPMDMRSCGHEVAGDDNYGCSSA